MEISEADYDQRGIGVIYDGSFYTHSENNEHMSKKLINRKNRKSICLEKNPDDNLHNYMKSVLRDESLCDPDQVDFNRRPALRNEIISMRQNGARSPHIPRHAEAFLGDTSQDFQNPYEASNHKKAALAQANRLKDGIVFQADEAHVELENYQNEVLINKNKQDTYKQVSRRIKYNFDDALSVTPAKLADDNPAKKHETFAEKKLTFHEELHAQPSKVQCEPKSIKRALLSKLSNIPSSSKNAMLFSKLHDKYNPNKNLAQLSSSQYNSQVQESPKHAYIKYVRKLNEQSAPKLNSRISKAASTNKTKVDAHKLNEQVKNDISFIESHSSAIFKKRKHQDLDHTATSQNIISSGKQIGASKLSANLKQQNYGKFKSLLPQIKSDKSLSAEYTLFNFKKNAALFDNQHSHINDIDMSGNSSIYNRDISVPKYDYQINYEIGEQQHLENQHDSANASPIRHDLNRDILPKLFQMAKQ